jgi:hypothetical protein
MGSLICGTCFRRFPDHRFFPFVLPCFEGIMPRASKKSMMN